MVSRNLVFGSRKPDIPSKYYGFSFHGFLSSFHLNAFFEKGVGLCYA